MIVLGFDTATPATAAALLLDDGTAFERRDDPPAGERPGHASRLLELIEGVLADGGVTWSEIDRIAVGVGPGGFTGLRIGISTARGLAQAHRIPLVPVGSLHALAAVEYAGGPVVAVIDARRGEAFAAAVHAGRTLLEPAALAPEALESAVRALPETPLAVGDGALRFRDELVRAGAAVPDAASHAHRLSAVAVCRLGAGGDPADRDALLPDYRREPDAKPPGP